MGCSSTKVNTDNEDSTQSSRNDGSQKRQAEKQIDDDYMATQIRPVGTEALDALPVTFNYTPV